MFLHILITIRFNKIDNTLLTNKGNNKITLTVKLLYKLDISTVGKYIQRQETIKSNKLTKSKHIRTNIKIS